MKLKTRNYVFKDGKKIKLARFRMETYLGRKLSPYEIVHLIYKLCLLKNIQAYIRGVLKDQTIIEKRLRDYF
jgi:hypothetical protein